MSSSGLARSNLGVILGGCSVHGQTHHKIFIFLQKSHENWLKGIDYPKLGNFPIVFFFML